MRQTNQRNISSSKGKIAKNKKLSTNKNIDKDANGVQKKFKNTRLFKLLKMALLILIIVFIINIISDLFHKKHDKVVLIMGENKIELKHDILVENDNIYLSKDDIANLYDENIYYNNADKTVITTYNKHIAILEMEKTTMSVNDSYTATNGVLKEKDGILYLPFSDMKIVYDFEYQYNNSEKVLIVDSISDTKNEAVVLKNCKLKEETGFFSKKLQKLKKTEYVTVLGVEGKYTKVRSNLGNIGYVKTEKLSKNELIREAMFEEKLENIKILDEYSVVESGYGEINKEEGQTLIVTPNLFNINAEFQVNNIINLEGNKFAEYSNWASQNGINICGIVTFDGSMNELCSNYVTRTYVINSLYTSLIKNKLTMICIDFNSIDDMEGFYRFVTEMVPRLKEAGIRVLVKNKEGFNIERLRKYG